MISVLFEIDCNYLMNKVNFFSKIEVVMDTKWQKNAHILINSESGYLKADTENNIRRTSFIGRIFFQIQDWYAEEKNLSI